MTSTTSLRVSEAVFGTLIVGLGLFIAFETYMMPNVGFRTMIGPQFFPYAISGGLVIVGAAALREAARGVISGETELNLDWLPVVLILGGLGLQGLLLESLGWMIASAAMFVAGALAFGERRLAATLLIGLVLSGVTFLVFDRGLGLDLPLGSVVEAVAGEK